MKRISMILALLAGCASTGVVSTGPDTYMIAGSGADFRGTAGISADLYTEANAFCAGRKKQLATITLTERNAIPFVRASSAKLEFRCVAPSDPATTGRESGERGMR